MDRAELKAAADRLAARAATLLARPTRAWQAIAEEPAAIPDLYARYVAPLAAIPAVCGAIGVSVFGISLLDVHIRPHLGAAALEMLVGFALTLVQVYVVALVVDVLAPAFGGRRSLIQAFKLSAYSMTPYWVLGIFKLLPSLGTVAAMVGGFWGLCLLYLGLPILMGAAPRHRLSYFAAVLLTVFAVSILLSSVTSRIRDLGGPLRMAAVSQAVPT